MKIAELDNLIKAVCPIHGISSTGRIDFKEEATQEQRAMAQVIMDQNISGVVL